MSHAAFEPNARDLGGSAPRELGRDPGRDSARDPGRDDSDEAHASRVTVAGRALAANLSVFWKTARLYDARNVAYMQSLQNLMESMQQLLSMGSDFVLQVVGDCLYINDQRLRVDVVGYASHQFIVDELAKRKVGGLRFTQGIERSELQTFTRIFLGESPQTPPDFDRIVADCDTQGVTHVLPQKELALPPTDPTDTETQGRRMVAKKTFFRAIQSTKNVMLSARRGKQVDLRQAKRAVQSIVDLILSQELSLLGMTTLKDYDEYTYQHCVNVAILSIAVGHRLGLTKQQLSQLGVSGLFHDIGKVVIPNEVLAKPGRLSPEEWALMQSHPIEGVKIITRLHGLSPLAMRAIAVAYEHHLNIDLSGYPRIKRPREQNLMSRIVAICDCFDAMTAHRSYQKHPFTPYEALHYMTTKIPERFDATLLKVFIQTVGIYPPGTLVRLSSGELALSIYPNAEDVTAPVVKVLREASGMPTIEERRIDLANQEGVSRGQNGYVTIVEAVHPENVNIRPEELVE
ncbi:MAG: HD-GYP domain-containing protein [Candidatus Eiseniibacteriota bacterium]